MLLLQKPKLLLQKPKQKPDKPQHPPVLLACRRKAAALGALTASLFSLLELQAYNRRHQRRKQTSQDGVLDPSPVLGPRESG